jgi:hypothetical protein
MARKRFTLILFGIIVSCGFLEAQTLDETIKKVAAEMSERLTTGNIVAFSAKNFRSKTSRLNEYVADELNNAIANIGKLKLAERARLAAIRDELQFNDTFEVSQESAMEMGRMTGAQSIITGSIEIIGSTYRLRFQVIATENATVQYSFSGNVVNDSVLKSLLLSDSELLNFTTGQRAGAAALNLLFGAGSFFVERDGFGGGITAGLEGVGIIAMVAGQLLYTAESASWGKYGDDYTILDSYYAYPFFIGLATYAGGAIFGIVRALIYDRPDSAIGMIPNNGLNIDLVSTQNNDLGVNVSYKWKY